MNIYETHSKKPAGIKFCRSCYDHLAGYVGVKMTESMEKNKWIRKEKRGYEITEKGWKSLSSLGIEKDNFGGKHRTLTRQCIDGTEKRPHLAGSLGAAILKSLIEKNWLKRVESTRVLIFTSKGEKEFCSYFGIEEI